MTENYVLKMYEKVMKWPFGEWLFSRTVAGKAPYFLTIKPRITALRPHYSEVLIRKRRGVENHIRTVHVIAIANGLELAMGSMAEASIPKHLRWIPKGMTLNYTAKATSSIVCTAEVAAEDWKSGDLSVKVEAKRDDGTVVVEGTITLWITEKG